MSKQRLVSSSKADLHSAVNVVVVCDPLNVILVWESLVNSEAVSLNRHHWCQIMLHADHDRMNDGILIATRHLSHRCTRHKVATAHL